MESLCPAPDLLDSPAAVPPRQRGPLEIVFLSGEPQTPGHVYRVEHHVAAARDLGHRVHVDEAARAEQATHDHPAPDIVVIWRAEWCPALEIACRTWRRSGARIVFDVDDYLFDPALARVEVIDGIRSLDVGEDAAARLYERVQRTLLEADAAFATTEPLAGGMRGLGKTAFVIPNGFDARTYRASRLAAVARRIQGDDGLVRIGYAAGSCTHQRDFAVVAAAVAGVLRDNPHCRLVIFRQGAFGRRLVDPAEFAELAGLAHQIEWRPLVPLHQLPEELARFDVNIAPLEVGNAFCEAKSELKFFEAALVGVPTVASPTAPFAAAIRDGETGILSRTAAEWRSALGELVADAPLRRRLGAAAALDALWAFGPECRGAAVQAALVRIVDGDSGADAPPEPAAPAARRPLPEVPDCELLFERQGGEVAEVAVVVSCRDAGLYVDAALDAVLNQSAASLELVVVDDGSTDDSEAVVAHWLGRHAGRFVAATHLRTRTPCGPALARNAGCGWASAPLVMPIGADILLATGCIAALRDTVIAAAAAAAWPTVEPDENGHGGAAAEVASDPPALVRRAAWAWCGGYPRGEAGREDRDLLDAVAAAGLASESVPRAIARRLCPGPTHPPVGAKAPRPAAVAATTEPGVPPPRPRDEQSLRKLLAILRCPATGRPLEWRSSQELITDDGSRTWPVEQLRPVLYPALGEVQDRGEHVSHTICHDAQRVIDEVDGLVLNLSAGGTHSWHPQVVEAETAIFRNTDVIADVHALPFVDGAFAAVIALNAFEHYRNPFQAAAEIARVLAPGGRLFMQTAFLQPAHEAPWHFFNATKHGVLEWFPQFTTETIRVSPNFNPFFTVGWLAHELGVRVHAHLTPAEAKLVTDLTLAEIVGIWASPDCWHHPVYKALSRLPQEAQEGIAAGFEYVGRRR